MKTSFRNLFLFLFLSLLSHCGLPGSDSTPDPDIPTSPLSFEFDTKMRLALGGVRPGWDQIVVNLNTSSEEVELQMDPPGLAESRQMKRENNSVTFQIIPLQTGIIRLTYLVNGNEQSKVVKVVIPPQEMVQVLLGEARSIIPQEVEKDEEGLVSSESSSPTARALLSVVRNRIQIMVEEEAPSLFVVDETDFNQADLAERYRLVIGAHRGSIYQFSPVNPADPSFDAYQAGVVRKGLTGNRLLTYDQGVLTAANIFDGSLQDNTFFSYGFYSPSSEQYQNLMTGLSSHSLPQNIGTSDGQFPALAPIQIRILDEISPQIFDENLPSFVFVGSRTEEEDSVVKF